jgi:hypothetical protein
MKKIYLIVALAMISVMSWATVSVSVNPNVIDFGTVNLDENGEADSNWSQAVLSWSGLIEYCSVFVDTLNAPAATAGVEFRITSDDGTDDYDSDYWYGGDAYTDPTSPNVWVKFYAIEAGQYSVKYGFYSFEDEDWSIKSNYAELLVKVNVLPHGETTGVENAKAEVKATKMVHNGQMLIMRNGVMYDMNGCRIEK